MLLGIISNIGVLAAAAVAMLVLSSRFKISTDQMQWHVVLGLVFGLICLIVVKMPIVTPLGATFDSRGGPVVLAGVFGGPIAALITATMGAIGRYEVGGPAVWGGLSVSLFTPELVRWPGYIFENREPRSQRSTS